MKRQLSTHSFFFERRREQRIPLVISVKEVSSEGTVLCLSSDISPTGMAVKRASSEAPPRDEAVTLEFSLPGMDAALSIPSHYLRSKQQRRYQEGVVLFSQLPAPLSSWLDAVGNRTLSHPVVVT